MRIYLAGPLGFSEAGRAFVDAQLIPMLRAANCQAVDPFALTAPEAVAAIQALPPGVARVEAWRSLNRQIARRNLDEIRAADALLAVLDGVDVDSGTAAEIGCAFALGKPVVGYRGDFRLSADNEGSTVNLQVEFFIRESGGDIVARLADIPAALARLPGRGGPRFDGA